jgi:hypothetical protein
VCLVFTILVFIDDGLDINIESFLVASLCALLFNYVLIRSFKITITDENMRSYDFWGKSHSIEWDSIVDVKPIQIAWLKYVRVIKTSTSRPLWEPIFFNDMYKFKRETTKAGGRKPFKRLPGAPHQ